MFLYELIWIFLLFIYYEGMKYKDVMKLEKMGKDVRNVEFGSLRIVNIYIILGCYK